MPPAGRTRVGRSPPDRSLRLQDLTATPGAGPPPAPGQRHERVGGGGTIGPDQGAPRAARAPGAQDHRPGAEPATPQKGESEPSRHIPTNETPPRCERERPQPSPAPSSGEGMNGRGAGIGRGRCVRLAGGTKAEPVAEPHRPAERESSAPGTLPPMYCRQARLAPRAAALPPPSPRASPGAIPAVGVDALEGGGGGHGAEERGRLARERSAERVRSEERKIPPQPTTGDRCKSLRRCLPAGPQPL
ncbi:not available [Pontoporia blainvillei]|uniref:Not available n=1 Tax=Pontoporia blainvillei TaxID=48723 RepID=A0ABX0SDY8_PONBL|nr:not available [Pontoporia blainvillei]